MIAWAESGGLCRRDALRGLVVQIFVGQPCSPSLLVLTYSSALVADRAGLFRLLFIQRLHRSIFRFARWAAAALAAAGVLAAIE